MRQVHCDGCNRTEPLGVPKADSIMMPVTIVFTADSRSWADSDAEKFSADLCDRCRAKVLHTFFNVPSEVDPELPRWISEPVSALGE